MSSLNAEKWHDDSPTNATWISPVYHSDEPYGIAGSDKPAPFTFRLYWLRGHGWRVEVLNETLVLPINSDEPLEVAKNSAIFNVVMYMGNIMRILPHYKKRPNNE